MAEGGFGWGNLFGSSWEDPKTMMMLQAAAGLLGGNPVGQNRATLGQSLSRGLLGGMQGYQQGLQMKRQGEKLDLEKREADLRDQQLQMQMDQQRQAMALQQQQQMLRGALPGLLDGQGMTGPQAMAQGGLLGSVGPTRANAQHMLPNAGGVTPQYLQAALASGMKIDDIKTLAGARQWNTPKVSKFENVRNADGSVSVVAFDEFGRPVQTGQTPFVKPEFMNLGGQIQATDPISLRTLGQWQNTPKPDLPEGMRMGANGQPEWIPGYISGRGQISAAGATRVNVPVNVNTEKQLFGQIADKIGDQIAAGADQARAAAGTLRTVEQIRGALDSGKVLAGPGTKAAVALMQVGQMIGVGGASGQEVLENTRTAIQGLAQLELNAAEQMKGQGQITESERKILRRAAAGDITDMNTGELRTVLGVLDRTARHKITANQRNVDMLGANPGSAPLAPYMQVPMPPAYQPPAAQPGATVSAPQGLGTSAVSGQIGAVQPTLDDLLRKYGGQ